MKDGAGKNHYAVEPFLDGAPDLLDESGEAEVIRLMARHNLNRSRCLAIIDDVIEAFGPREFKTEDTNGADAETIRQLASRQRQAWHILVAYQANQKQSRDMQMSTRVMALELGYYTVAGADNVAELHAETGVVLQIALATGEFRPGRYVCDKYRCNWHRADEG